MYLVGFYSPRKKSGVTEMSLSVSKRLREITNLSVAFVSNGELQKEPINEYTFHLFSKLSLGEQRKKMKELRKKFDVVVYDVSSNLSSDNIKLLSIVDRLFILGEDDTRFADTLYNVIECNKIFDKNSRDLVNQVHNDGAFVMPDNKQKIGFTKNSDLKVKETSDIIYQDYCVYFLHEQYIRAYKGELNKIKKVKVQLESLGEYIYKLGVEFEKAVLFQKFVELRALSGQPYEKALEDLLPLIISNDYSVIYQMFHNELGIAQISFAQPTTKSRKKNSNVENDGVCPNEIEDNISAEGCFIDASDEEEEYDEDEEDDI